MPFTPLSPLNDFVFKKLMGNRKRTARLAEFLQTVIDIPKEEYADIRIMNPEIPRDFRDGKSCVLDVKIQTKSGWIINVEIQVEPQDWMHRRILFYAARMITEQVGKGEDYDQVKPVISIVISKHQLLSHGKNYHHCFTLYDRKERIKFPGRLMEIHTLEIPKLPPESDSMPLWSWLRFFAAKTKGEFAMTSRKHPAIAEALQDLMELSSNRRFRWLAEQRELARRDEAGRNSYRNRIAEKRGEKRGILRGLERGMVRGMEQGMEKGMERGLENGLERGAKQKALDTARIALRKNYPTGEIVELSGLTVEEIAQLRESLGL